MNGMSLREMDKIIYPVCRLCRDHERSGFVEGIKIGVRLQTELTEEWNYSPIRLVRMGLFALYVDIY